MVHRMRMAMGIAFPVLMSAACAGPAERSPSFTVTDSAGVRVVTNARPLWRDGEGWSIDSAAAVAFGADERDTVAMLQRIGAMSDRTAPTLPTAELAGEALRRWRPLSRRRSQAGPWRVRVHHGCCLRR
jgi:hypothetical protein